jgi:hypothetical protein
MKCTRALPYEKQKPEPVTGALRLTAVYCGSYSRTTSLRCLLALYLNGVILCCASLSLCCRLESTLKTVFDRIDKDGEYFLSLSSCQSRSICLSLLTLCALTLSDSSHAVCSTLYLPLGGGTLDIDEMAGFLEALGHECADLEALFEEMNEVTTLWSSPVPFCSFLVQCKAV